MNKYNEVQSAIIDVTSTIGHPADILEKDTGKYSTDTLMFKKDIIQMPREILQMSHGGTMGNIDELSLVWSAKEGKLLLWDYSTYLINEIDVGVENVLAVYPVVPKPGVYASTVDICLLVFTDKEIAMVCRCNNPLAYLPMEMVVGLPVQMSCVCEYAEGRVVLGGTDGNIYEYVYGNLGWFKSHSAKVVCHTQSIFTNLMPFMQAMNKKPPVIQILPTRKGVLVLHEDNTLDAYELTSKIRKIRTTDLLAQNITAKDKLTLIKMEGREHQAYLMVSTGARYLLDSNGTIIGQKNLPAHRDKGIKTDLPHNIQNERYFKVGDNLVALGTRDTEGVITLISPNPAEVVVGIPKENCSVITASSKAICIISSSIGRPPKNNRAEYLVKGREFAVLTPTGIETYQIMDGYEFIQRAGTNPEGLFSYLQRVGESDTLVAALYSRALGVVSMSIDTLFKKQAHLLKRAISRCLAILIYSVWEIPLTQVVQGVDIDPNEYLEAVEQAMVRLKRLRLYVIKESESAGQHRHSVTEGIVLLTSVIEMLQFMLILLGSDIQYILKEAAERLQEKEIYPSLDNLLNPENPLRKTFLNILIDMHLSQKASIDSISALLNEKCPTIFALNETLFLKGKEALEKASRARLPEDKTWYMNKSIEYFQASARNHIKDIVDLYEAADYPRGILLALKAGIDELEKDEAVKYFSRVKYTDEILREALTDNRAFYCNTLLDSVIEKIRSKELGIDILLKSRSPYLEDYLDRLDRTSDNIDLCDLVWKYHLKKGSYSTAALYLFRTAERTTPFITLQTRIKYLAIACTMQAASETKENAPTGKINDYSPKLGMVAKDRLDMAQTQAEIMSAIASMYSPEKTTNSSNRTLDLPEVEKVFDRLEKTLLSYEELFEICVGFGFSLIALKIAAKGQIEDRYLNKQLWLDTLKGPYSVAIQTLRENKELAASAPIDIVTDILIDKRLKETKGENLGNVLLFLGFSPVTIARLLESKAETSEHSDPHNKRIILSDSIAFCEEHSLSTLAHRMISIKRSLGL
ncbi:nuclear pore complex protein Nup155 [Nematocida sp. AWRm80]|nr:nuclear pore complex protein Nup155 [Nematocida sp. AWRm80]